MGYSLQMPETVDVEKPVPLTDQQKGAVSGDFNRWACESQSTSFTPLSKDHFLSAWGEPKEKIVTVTGETWIYRETGRWCGLWLAVIIPIPFVLPVCETFDYVYFEQDVALRIKSRRIVQSSAGIMLTPYGFVPGYARSGKITENKASINTFPGHKSPDENMCSDNAVRNQI